MTLTQRLRAATRAFLFGEYKQVRHYAATKRESAAARRRKADIECGLAVYNATTTNAQRRKETEAFFERARRA